MLDPFAYSWTLELELELVLSFAIICCNMTVFQSRFSLKCADYILCRSIPYT
jgi:hypothetical protein